MRESCLGDVFCQAAKRILAPLTLLPQEARVECGQKSVPKGTGYPCEATRPWGIRCFTSFRSSRWDPVGYHLVEKSMRVRHFRDADVKMFDFHTCSISPRLWRGATVSHHLWGHVGSHCMRDLEISPDAQTSACLCLFAGWGVLMSMMLYSCFMPGPP